MAKIIAVISFILFFSVSLLLFSSPVNAGFNISTVRFRICSFTRFSFPGCQTSTVTKGNSYITLGTGVLIDQALGKEKERLCQAMQQYGSGVNWITLSWQRIQPANKNQWIWKQFDSWVDGYRSCEQKVMVHILSDAAWATGSNKPSMPAKNPQDYYNFIYEVAKHYKGKITHYAIENEAHAAVNWGGTSDQYIEQLKLGYKAVHAADPQALVTDAGMSHEGLGYLTANWLVEQGREAEALRFVNSYAEHLYPGNEPPHWNTLDELKQILASPGVQKTIEWENNLFKNHQYFDEMQIHNGAPWQDLEKVLEYLHANLKAQGDDKPLTWWEGWYSWKGAPKKGYNPQIHAQDMVKQIITGLGNGVNEFIYWTFTDYALGESHVGLIDNFGNPRPAAIAFQTTSQKLTGTTNREKLNLGNAVWGYKFQKNGKNVYVLWSENKTSIDLPPTRKVTVTDIYGKTTIQNASSISVSQSPIFVE